MAERALALGATAADALAMEADAFSVQVRLGDVENTTGARDKGLGLRVFHGTRSATASTSDFSADAIERLVATTCELARLTEADPDAGLPDQPGPDTLPDLDLFDGGLSLSIAERIDLARRAEAVAMGADPRITNSEGASFDSSQGEVAYARSNGFSGSYRTTSYGLSTVPVAEAGGGMQRDYWFSSARHFADLLDPEAVGAEAARRVLRRLGAKQVPTCEVPVILEPQMAGGLLGHLVAAVSGSAIYKGTSFLADKLGERILPPGINVYDDALRPRGLGSRPFDGEGVGSGRRKVVDDGVLRSFLLDSYSARKLSMTTTGNASRGLGGTPSPAATNFYLEPGAHSLDGMIRATPRGLLVTELIGFGVNGVTGDYSRGAVGVWIENGELTHPVEEVTISGNLLEMFARIDMVGGDLDLSRRIAAPSVRIARMTLAGS
ncbi:MAG: TldD/PmbA family protein [Nitrospirae bacterium]|nr:TldD/PmbA family protein [Nitrospirota bacterium]